MAQIDEIVYNVLPRLCQDLLNFGCSRAVRAGYKMSDELTIQDERALAPRTAIRWDDAELLETIKQTVCKNATDSQFRMFIEVCKATGLNPFLKEIWYVPSVGVMAGRDGYLRKANEHPQFDGMETRVERDAKDIPIKAVCTVWRKDRNHPVIAEAYYNEYKKGGNVWQTYPSAMISKVAEVLALKRSFAINGVVTEEEIGTKEERGSREAQVEYLESKGIAAPAPKEKRKRGTISFDALKDWGKLKKDVAEVTGSTELYYTALNTYGYDHADEIKTKEDGISIWRIIGAGLTKARADKELTAILEHASEVLGVRTFGEILKRHSIDSIESVLSMESDPLTALLAEIKFFVDEKKSGGKSPE